MIRGTVNESILSAAKYYEVPAAPQTGIGRDGQSYEWIVAAGTPTELRDIDLRSVTTQSALPSNRHNGPTE